MDTLVQIIIVVTTLIISFVAMNVVDYLCIRGNGNGYIQSLVGVLVLLILLVPVTLFLFL
jgi:hypothetical protein